MNAPAVPIAARRSELWFEDMPRLLEKAVADYDFEASSAFDPLKELSTATRLDGVDVGADSAVVSKDGWTAPGTAYVTLVYDPNGKEPVEIDDAYPIIIHFNVDNERVTISKIETDVSSFFE